MLSGNRQTCERYCGCLQEGIIFLSNISHYSNIMIERFTYLCLKEQVNFRKGVLAWLK